TDDEMFLDAFQAATENTGRTLTMLSRLTRDNPRQQATLEELAPAAHRRLDLLRQNLDRRLANRPMDLEVARAGFASMAVVNGLSDQLRAEEERLLQDRLRASEAAKLELQLTGVGTAALGLVLLLALRTVAHRDRGRLLRARAAAEGTQERLQAIVDGAPALIYLKDREGRFVLVNRATLHLLDRGPEQVLGRGPESLFESADARAIAAHDALVWREQREITFAETVSIGGATRQYRSEKFLLPGQHGEPAALLCGISTDITDLLAAQQAVRTANEALEARVEARTRDLAQANADLQAFAHTVAHDLRAPLRNVQGFAQALVEDEGDRLSSDGRLFTERISAGVVRMDQLITDLLEYSRLGRAELRLERVELSAVVQEVLQQLASDIERTGATVEVPPALPAVLAHRSTLVQVLANLVGNALKFVEAQTVPTVRLDAQPGMGRVHIVVQDNGIGIAPEHQERVFRVFERLHGAERYPGTGIGLAIVRRGIGRMGGTVSLESAPGSGSRFTLDLPAA
ncbi:MAG TPA: ATP-binding protein, partial [Ramlibacter sp.]